MPENSVNLHILPWQKPNHKVQAKGLSHSPGFKMTYLYTTELRIHLGESKLYSNNPATEGGMAFLSWTWELPLFSSPPTSLWMWNSDGLMRSRHWSLWTWSIFKWAMRTWTVYRFWKNEIWGEKRKFDTYRETDLWGWEKIREGKY